MVNTHCIVYIVCVYEYHSYSNTLTFYETHDVQYKNMVSLT